MKRLALLAVLSSLATSGLSQAAPQDTKAEAQAAYDLGRKLSLAGNFAEACPKFEESEKLDPGLGTMLFLADCYEKTGKTASAWGQFREAEAVASKTSDSREKVAHDRAAALEPKLSRVVIKVSFPNKIDGLRVYRDEVDIGEGVWNTPLPIDPGAHAITARASGYRSWTENVQITTTAMTTTVVVPQLLPDPVVAPANPVEGPAKPPIDHSPDTQPTNDGKAQRILGLATAGVGVIAAGVGTIFGLHANARLADSNADGHCRSDNHCDQIGVDARSDAKSAATLSTIAFVASGVLVAGGAVLYFTAPHAKNVTAQIAPAVGPRTAGLVLGASW